MNLQSGKYEKELWDISESLTTQHQLYVQPYISHRTANCPSTRWNESQ